MSPSFLNPVICGAVMLSLFFIDYSLGHGCLDMIRRMFCKMLCFMKSTLRQEMKNAQNIPENMPISFSVLIAEIVVLTITMLILNKYKHFRSKDRIDDLLNESKEALRQTNEFLEKWRVRRVPTEYSYLDEEPQEIKPLKIEVPILHMAIVDTLGTTRSQPERGDAGDTINITDSTLLSLTSLINEDFDSVMELTMQDKELEEETDLNHGYGLMDLMKEDANNLSE